MLTTNDSWGSFEQTDTRSDEMYSTIEQWIDELVADVNDVQASEEFQEWLNVQSRFHDYSHRNTLLIRLQCPEATKVAGYNTWRNEFDRHVQEGEQAIWAPIIAKQCPECENSPSYHEDSDCEYDETSPEEWSKGLVGFKPTTSSISPRPRANPFLNEKRRRRATLMTSYPRSQTRRMTSV